MLNYFKLKSDEVFVEIRNPHEYWRVIGIFASSISRIVYGYELVKIPSTNLNFVLHRDGERLFVDITDMLEKCNKCGKDCKSKYGVCYNCFSKISKCKKNK